MDRDGADDGGQGGTTNAGRLVENDEGPEAALSSKPEKAAGKGGLAGFRGHIALG